MAKSQTVFWGSASVLLAGSYSDGYVFTAIFSNIYNLLTNRLEKKYMKLQIE